MTIEFATSQSYAGQTPAMSFPCTAAVVSCPRCSPLADVDVVFLCLPHSAAAEAAVAALQAGAGCGPQRRSSPAGCSRL
ncbi:MAG: hypothetical protein R3C44_11330 [Chloroflexota bacterium]